MKLSSIEGKVFQLSPEEEFGPIRPVQGGLPEELYGENVLAEDSCGNFFLRDGEGIIFWDHETSEITKLAPSLTEFFAKCIEPSDVDLKECQFGSVWVDPEFAKEMGIERKP